MGLAEMLSGALQASSAGSQLQIQGPWYPHNTGSRPESLPLDTISWLISVIFCFPFQLYHAACGILASQPGTEPTCHAVEMWGVNDCTTREDPLFRLIVVPSLLWASLMAQTVKNLPAGWETLVQSLGWEDPLEEEMATHSRILAWRIPWTEEPGGVQSTGSQRVRHD